MKAEELQAGGVRLKTLVGRLKPDAVAIAGVTAFRTAFGDPKAQLGRREQLMSSSEVWILPNPSGLNAHETIESLGKKFRAVGEAAGLL